MSNRCQTVRLRRRAPKERNLFRPLVVALVAATVVLAISEIALAKGPQSATITGPGIDEPIELLDTPDPGLAVRLFKQTELWETTRRVRLEEPSGDLGPRYTLTWINLGPPELSVDERTIRQFIYPDAENGPIIHTPAQDALEDWGPEVIGWFAAPAGLWDTLAELGVPISAATSINEARDVVKGPNAVPSAGETSGVFWYVAASGFALLIGLAWGIRRRSSNTKASPMIASARRRAGPADRAPQKP